MGAREGRLVVDMTEGAAVDEGATGGSVGLMVGLRLGFTDGAKAGSVETGGSVGALEGDVVDVLVGETVHKTLRDTDGL